MNAITAGSVTLIMSARTEELHQPVDFSAAQALAPEQYKAPEMTATFHAGKMREWMPGAVQGPLHETAGLFLNEAVQVPEFTALVSKSRPVGLIREM